MDSAGSGDVPSCVNHPAAPVAGQCARCGASFCRFCLVTLGDQKLCTRCKGTQKIPAKAPTGNTGMIPRRTTQMMTRKGDDFSPFGPPQKPPEPKAPAPPPPPAAKPRFVPAAERAAVPPAFVAPVVEKPPEPEVIDAQPAAPAYPKGTLRMLRERRPTAGPGTLPSASSSALKSTLPAGTIACKNHISAAATRACNRCSAFYCPSCVKKLHEMQLCPVCADPLRELTPQELNQPVVKFQEQLPACFSYPFVGEGLWVLGIGTIVFWLCGMMYVGMRVLAAGYLVAYAMRVIKTSAIGQARPPGWPSFSNVFDSMLIPLWRFSVPAVAAIALPMVVLFAVGPASDPEDDFEYEPPPITGAGQLTEQDVKNGLPEFQHILLKREKPHREPESYVIFWTFWLALWAACLFLLPMALLGVTLFNSFDVLNPAFLVSAVAKVPFEYVCCYIALIVAVLAQWSGEFLSTLVPFAGAIAAQFVSFYILIVQSRMLGLLYFEKQDTLKWFNKVVTVEEQRKLEEQKEAEKAGYTF